MRVPLSILTKNCIFGYEEISEGKNRETQAQCVSSFSEVFSIKSEVI